MWRNERAEWGKLECRRSGGNSSGGEARPDRTSHRRKRCSAAGGGEMMLKGRTYEAIITRCWRGAFEFFSGGNNVAALDCCRYKDNRAYPWPGGESHFILYPESANQTIYAQKVRASDAGRYSCRARNDTTILEGDITLAVLG